MASLALDLSGSHALVTGGGTGIGRAVALALDGCGASVTVLGRREEPLRETAAMFVSGGGWVTADVTDEASIAAAVADANAARGAIAILVNNAGAGDSAPFRKTSRASWDRMVALNQTSVFSVTQAVLPQILEQPWGRVINLASTAGLKGYAYVSAYVASKHAVVGLTRALALELAKTAVTVNAVCPGYTETPLLDGAVEGIVRKTGRTSEEARAEIAKTNPQGRLIEVDEVAETVMWLCSAGARSVTGQAIAVAGGEVM